MFSIQENIFFRLHFLLNQILLKFCEIQNRFNRSDMPAEVMSVLHILAGVILRCSTVRASGIIDWKYFEI